MVFSEFADKLRCQYCGKTNRATDWPAQGDSVPFYFQTEPGKFYVSVRCPHCEKDWYVTWDDNPGPGCQTGAKALAGDFTLPVKDTSNDFTLPVDGTSKAEETPGVDISEKTTPQPPGTTSEPIGEDIDSEPEEKGFLAKLSQACPYTVLLAVSLAAILIAILFLFMELMVYDLDIKARQGKEGALLVPAAQSAPASTIAAA